LQAILSIEGASRKKAIENNIKIPFKTLGKEIGILCMNSARDFLAVETSKNIKTRLY